MCNKNKKKKKNDYQWKICKLIFEHSRNKSDNS